MTGGIMLGLAQKNAHKRMTVIEKRLRGKFIAHNGQYYTHNAYGQIVRVPVVLGKTRIPAVRRVK